MTKTLRALAVLALLLAAASLASAQDACQIERAYDRFTDRTHTLCVVAKVGQLTVALVADFKGKEYSKNNIPEYSFSLSRLDTSAASLKPDPADPALRPVYRDAKTLFILADDFRAQLSVGDYKTSVHNGIIIERTHAPVSRADLLKIIEATDSEARYGATEIKFSDDARRMMKSFVEQIEGAK